MSILKLNIEAGKTLLISGPALIKLIEGKCEILGAPLNFNVLIRKYKQLPITALQPSELEINLGEGASINEINHDAIPDSWNSIIQKILNEKKVIVIGGVDSGKNAFCTLLVNKFLKVNNQVVIIDVDVGQTEIGPPTTIGLGLIEQPIFCFSNISTKLLFFTGHITPSKVKDKIVFGLKKMFQHHFTFNNPIIINTDGWILGDEAKQYKLELINLISPSLVIGLGEESVLKPIFEEAFKPYIILEPSQLVRKRTQEERRALREDSYRNYLRSGKIITLPITQIKVRFFNEQKYECNTLLGLLSEDEWLIGLGIFKELKGKLMKIYTPIKKEEIKIVEFSEMKINEEGKELNITKSIKDKIEFKRSFC
ncbi:MAG: Clp1/GlmU family protein [Candidatus Bathyarchaeia archaeon]|nr:hypothetical protein [Candidatus Bathyarchaeota archaeon]